ncbi:MAG: peptidylprolyl isomerase [Sedimentisphaerales bacterium]|nr:peptidylprolyl isomerase [Sedimentisphaerales bacterium]
MLCSFGFAAQYPQVRLDVADGVSGSITIELYTDKAPITCANFIMYVQSGFYNDLIFHHVKNSMIQCGGYDQYLVYKLPTYPPIISESANRLSNLRGTVAMARTPDPDSATSQFFINVVDNNGTKDYGAIADNATGEIYRRVGYCVFGHVVDGMDVVDSISNVVTVPVGLTDVPVIPIIIQNATIVVEGPVCAEKFSGDINGDCKVDFNDFAMLAAQWLQSNSLTACAFTVVGDLNYDCTVNFEDVAMLTQNWLMSVSGPPCVTALTGDINEDCRVDFKDFSLLAAQWFKSSL